VHQTVVDQFLAILVSVISFNQFSRTAVRALKILFEYLKNGKLHQGHQPCRLLGLRPL